MDQTVIPQLSDELTKQENYSEQSSFSTDKHKRIEGTENTESIFDDKDENLEKDNPNAVLNVSSQLINSVISSELKDNSEIEKPEINIPISPDDIKEPNEPDHVKHCPEINSYEAPSKGDNIEPYHLKDVDTHPHDTKGDEGEVTCNEECESEKWTFILGHDQIKKRVIKEGDETTSKPQNGQLIHLRCSGKLDDGASVDVHDRLEFTLGEDEFLNAFDLCVPLMHKGEICELVTEARFAYGEKGREPDIPSNARITYKLELLDVQDQTPYALMPLSERTVVGEKKRERGNDLYMRGEFSRSIDTYNRALKVLGSDDENHNNEDDTGLLQTLLDARIKCYNNMAAAQMKIEAWEAASRSCDQVLKVQPENVKALFRKGKCLVNQRDTMGAVSCLKKALKLDPESKIIQQELQRLVKKKQQENEMERMLYKKMLGAHHHGDDVAMNKQHSSNKWLWYSVGAASVAGLSALIMVYHRWSHY